MSSVVFEGSYTFNREETGPVRRIFKTITTADLTDAAMSQTLTVGIPSSKRNVFILGVGLELMSEFTDGAAGSFTLDLGTAADPDRLVDGADISSAVEGVPAAAPDGIAPRGVVLAGEAIAATVSGDVNVDTATAGEVKVSVIFVEVG